MVQKVISTLTTCIIVLEGAIIGTIKGKTKETGLVCGARSGPIAGNIKVIQLLESMVNGEPYSKDTLLCNLVNDSL